MIQFIASPLIALSPYQGRAARDGYLWRWSLDGVASIDLPHPVTAVAMNARSTCAVANGALYCWDGYPQPPSPQPVLPLTKDVRAVALGAAHACAVKRDQLYCWGRSQYGQAGAGGDTPIMILDSKVKALAVGNWHTCALYDQ
jgi:alpha-tubulin suppressor-like RCC1 family protein